MADLRKRERTVFLVHRWDDEMGINRWTQIGYFSDRFNATGCVIKNCKIKPAVVSEVIFYDDEREPFVVESRYIDMFVNSLEAYVKYDRTPIPFPPLKFKK